MKKSVLLLFVITLFVVSWASAAPLPDTDTLPTSLKQWKPWVLHGEEEQFCPTLYNDGESFQCVWPSVLDLQINGVGAKFSQKWRVFIKGWVPLPGGKKQWPEKVRVDGKHAAVIEKDGSPSVYLKPGTYSVAGSFSWNEMPEMIRIPPASGLVSLLVNGKKIEFPLLDSNGRLWLQTKKAASTQEERVEVRVCRLLNDTVPMRITSRLSINVSGRAREIKVGGVLLDPFIPLSITSKLPARLGAEGELMIQARPGRWEIRVLARSQGPVNGIRPVDLPFGEEIWAFQSQNYLRMVKVEGVPSVDPTQTDLPSGWKRFPTFIVRPGEEMTFKEIRRGDPDPAPDQLHLNRIWWLDFNGRGLTIQDRINGTMSRQWFLAMNPPGILGRVSVDGSDQLITSQGAEGKPGVELRRGKLNLVSESRFEASTKNLPAVGWDHDFQSVSGALNLPPGWRLLTARGVDVMPGTWFSQWTLLDLFLVLIIALSIYKLWDWRLGVLALLTLGLSYHEPGAPRMVWLHLLGAIALLRVLPVGWVRKGVNIWCLVSFVTLLVLAIPFMVQQVRWGIYPQLEPHVSTTWSEGKMAHVGDMALDNMVQSVPNVQQAPMEREMKTAQRLKSYAKTERYKGKGGYSRQKTLMTQDPNALIQTGPGLPKWKWRSYSMKWNGPVERYQPVRIWLLSPVSNFILSFIRVLLLAGLIVMLIDFRKWKIPSGTFTFASVLVCLMLIPGVAIGENEGSRYPSNALLEELKERLLEKPDCLPDCAESPKMVLNLDLKTLHILFKVHAAVETAVPLPGSLELWRPEQVFLDSRPATGLFRNNDGSLWVLVPKGIHSVTIVGSTPDESTFQIPLPLRPQRVSVRSSGWDVQGIDDDGMVEGDIKFTRQENEQRDYKIQPARSLPPFLHIERVLSLGLNWQVWTTVRRVSPPGTPIVVSVPLIAGESVTTAGVNVKDRSVNVNMGPGVREIRWNSTLKTENKIALKASENVAWTETWILDASPIWHCDFKGIPVVHHQDHAGQWRPEWRPWPGEGVSIHVTRPAAIPGQSVTIDSAKLTFTPGERFNKASLALSLRSSKGGQHRIGLPEGANLQLVKISGKTQPIRQQGREILVPLRPGNQTVDVDWHQSSSSLVLSKSPEVTIGEQAVNAEVIFNMPRNRWLLLTHGPCLGPAVLFWSYLFVIVLAGVGLGLLPWTPLTTRHWLLLGLGLTQVYPIVAIMIVGWLLALGLRKKYSFPGGWFSFNASQIILVGWTFAALAGLYEAIRNGLLGIPYMQISGNGSYDYFLHWTQDRIGSVMPEPWAFSLPLLVFRILMLLWALWLAYSLLKWLRWGWNCFGEGGLWRRIRKPKEPKPEPPPLPPQGPNSGKKTRETEKGPDDSGQMADDSKGEKDRSEGTAKGLKRRESGGADGRRQRSVVKGQAGQKRINVEAGKRPVVKGRKTEVRNKEKSAIVKRKSRKTLKKSVAES